MGEQMNIFGQDTSSGKTCREHSPQTKEMTSDACSKRSAKSASQTYLFLKVRNGQTQGLSWRKVTVSDGESSMLNIGEYPREENASFLSQILRGGGAEQILFKSEGMSGYSAESFRAWKRVANDVEGSIGETSEGIGFDGYNQCSTGTISKGLTNRATDSDHVPVVFENHSQDARYTGPIDVSTTVMAAYGTGGNNQPFVVETPKLLKIRCGCEGGGKGALIQEDKSATLSCNNDQTLFVPTAFGICSKDSGAMKSDNPKSGFYEADTSRTLDGNGGNPSCNQGGMAVVSLAKNSHMVLNDQGGERMDITEDVTCTLRATSNHPPVVAVEGNEARPSHQGSGYSEEGISFTQNATEQRGVAYGIDRATYNMGQNAKFGIAVEEEVEPTMVAKGPGAVGHPVYSTSKGSYHTLAEENLVNTLMATDYKDPPVITEDPYYIVRRLTPTECARLQGFPDWWCDSLETDNPTAEDMNFWRGVFKTYAEIMGTKPKSDKQIIEWLKSPRSDSSEYKMWGNGVALPCVWFVMAGIAWWNEV